MGMIKSIRRNYTPLPNIINEKKRNFSNCSIEQILKYWMISIHAFENKKIKLICDLGEPECFACGNWTPEPTNYIIKQCKLNDPYDEKIFWKIVTNGWEMKKLERCHLHAHCFGGDERYSNIVLLCFSCHQQMDSIFLGYAEDRQEQLRWIHNYKTNQIKKASHYIYNKYKEYNFPLVRGVADILLSSYNNQPNKKFKDMKKEIKKQMVQRASSENKLYSLSERIIDHYDFAYKLIIKNIISKKDFTKEDQNYYFKEKNESRTPNTPHHPHS